MEEAAACSCGRRAWTILKDRVVCIRCGRVFGWNNNFDSDYTLRAGDLVEQIKEAIKDNLSVQNCMIG